MVAKGGPRQSSGNAGELDSQLAGRVDIKQYYSGGLQYRNIEPVPQSGFRQMPGTLDTGAVRGTVFGLTVTSPTPAAGPHTGTQTVWSGTVAGPVAAVYVPAIVASAGAHSATVEIQVGGVWTQIGPSIAIGTTAKARTFAVPPGAQQAATGVRIRVVFGSSASVTVGTILVLQEGLSQPWPRYGSLRHDTGDRYSLSLGPRFLDIYLDDAFVAGVWLPVVMTDHYPLVDFYTENATIGLFQRNMRPQRVRRSGSPQEWTVDDWPLEGVPKVDLGGVYPKTADKWIARLRWTQLTLIFMNVSVDGESGAAIQTTLTDGSPGNSSNADWNKFASDIADSINALPSVAGGVVGVNLTGDLGGDGNGWRDIEITFSGAAAGREYQLDLQITNTANASVLSTHTVVGKTEFEPIASDGRGWPGITGLVQDRLAYADFLAEPGALSLSQAAEYFNLNIESQGASAARLDRLRAGQTAERILAIKDATYLLIFTDQQVHFAANRSITRTDPLNFTITSEVGIVANTEPVDLEGRIYFIARNDDEFSQSGNQILSLAYDEIASRFDANPESLIASHLVRNVMRTKRQKSGSDTDASRMWMLRADGLLIAAQVIRSQEILGLCRWYAAAGGLVREIEVDARNRMRVCVERGGRLRHERLDPALFLHAVVRATANLSGVVSGLSLHEGREVWASVDGYVSGPYTVTGGAITLETYFAGTIDIGLWQPPLYETMPRWHIRPNDEIVKRPGRIHSAFIDVIDTTSIAVGANGQPARTIPLARIGDPAEAPTPPATRKLTITGMLGVKDGTTLTITQTRPGKLHVRDFVLEEKL